MVVRNGIRKNVGDRDASHLQTLNSFLYGRKIYGNISILEGLSITETVLNLPVSKYVITGVVGLLNIYCHM